MLREETCHISPNNRSFRYGDGFFETMKLVNGKIVLAQYHFERLFASLVQLQFEPPAFFTPSYLNDLVTELVLQNNHPQLARIRITIFRGDGGLYDPENHYPHCLVQSWPLQQPVKMNENGLIIDIFRDAVKTTDQYSAVKSNNYLGYAMAALWAKKNHLNDALLLNASGRVADATIANLFVVHEGVVKTPPLSEGGVNGVMRRHLLAAMKSDGWAVEEVPVTEELLLQSTECFLTNVISGIRWVKALKNNTFRCNLSALLYNNMIKAQLW
jgi:branched-chain amino acid aminotransferase